MSGELRKQLLWELNSTLSAWLKAPQKWKKKAQMKQNDLSPCFTNEAPKITLINDSLIDLYSIINSATSQDGRYYIGFDGSSVNHMLNAYRVDGKLYIYDQQINGSYDLI